MYRSSLFLPALIVVPVVVAGPLGAQRERRSDPENCPYCHNEPEVMAKAGIVSHGGFEFGAVPHDTKSTQAFLATSDVFWIESAHFEIGFALGKYRVGQKEKGKIRAELRELSDVLPDVDPKTKVLDEFLRAHMFAQRCEKVWDRFLEVVQKKEADFPAVGQRWILGTPYMGEGPYVGQQGKFEILLLETEAEHVAYLNDQFGLNKKQTQRWNVVERDTITVTIHIRQGQFRTDTALHGHVAFNLAHNLLDGYKHYSYDTPLWIHEGLAHLLEREVSIRYNSFDGQEGGIAKKTRKEKWIPEVRKMISQKKAPRMAELINLKNYASFELETHFATWSMMDFLARVHPDGLACLIGRIHGRKTADGMPDSSNLRDVHREAFKECLGMSYAEFDGVWKEWVGSLVDRKD